jgi:hypothetical protein
MINPIAAPRRAFLTVISDTMTSGQITDFVGVALQAVVPVVPLSARGSR